MKKRILSILLLCCMVLTLLPTAAFAAGEIDEQFTLAPGGTYYFDLSAMGIPGTVNDALPDKTMRYVPFTYAGTVDSYKLTSEMATTEEYAETYKYAHSLFIADFAVTHEVSWDNLNAKGLIFGKDCAAGGVDYILRAPSVGSGRIGSAESQRGTPPSNEWDRILDKNDGYIKNWFGMYSWGQDTLSTSASDRAARGYFPPGGWSSAPVSHQDAVAGFRPVLEVLNPGSLGSDGLKAVTLDLGGGKLGDESSIQIIVETGSVFTAPASDGLTRPDGNTGNYFMWRDNDGQLYAPGDYVPADVTKLTAQFNLPEQFTLAPGGTYYFDLSGAGIPGTANDALPDATLHYVPFTYAGMVNAYKLTSAMETTEEYAEKNKYDHSLFVAEYNVTRAVSWTDLNTAGLIFGKDYTSDGVDYTLRAPSVGSASTGAYDLERGTPQSNEWDKILDKGSGYIQNWKEIESRGQDIRENWDASAHRGYMSARYWNCSADTLSQPYQGFRPILEVLGLDTLGDDGLKAVTLDLDGGKLGNSSEDIQIIVKSGESFAAPASDSLTRPDGNTDNYFKWLGSDGKLYVPGGSVPANVNKLTAQFDYTEQFTLDPGGTYYFDLSGVNIPGTVNDALPDKTMHYVPFTYAGTVDAYKLTSEMATTEEYAQKNKYPHSLFVADYAVTHTVSWDDLNTAGLIFGKDYAAGGVGYTLRAPSCGSGFTDSGDSERGTPQSNEWDAVLNKNSGYIQNWNQMYSWGQDAYFGNASDPAVRGYYSARTWSLDSAAFSTPNVGFRPVLEILNPDALGSDGLKVVTLDLGGGTLGGSSDAIQIIVKTGSEFTAPASDGMTRPNGDTGSYFMWLGSDGKLYAPSANVPAEVTKLTAQFALSEQFSLKPGGTYYFDLSSANIPGTANGSLPDSTLHYVPFTYAGTIEAYKLTSAMATTEEYAQQNKYPHSLFVADYAVTHTVSWNGLNDEGLIFGKNYASGGVDYTLRAPSVGSNATGSGDSQRGVPQSNEWDTMLNKNSGYIKNWNGIYSWGQDTTRYNSSFRAVRGFISARLWGIDNAASSDPNVVFRPVLEILNPDTLGSDGLKVVTLDLGGGTLGNSSEDIQIIVKTGSEFTAPASDGMTRPNGDTGSYFMWLGSDGKLYAPSANVPADVTKLTAQFALSEQFTLTPGGTYYFDLSAMGIPGTVNDALPDNTLHYVPFTYAGTADAYKLMSEMATTEEYAQQKKYPHSLFVADYVVTHTVSWNDLDTASLIFGKDYVAGSVDYTLRAPSVGSSYTGSGDSERGTPKSNEWDKILDKDDGYIKNWREMLSCGQDTTIRISASSRAVRGWNRSARFWTSYNTSSSSSYPTFGFRPVLEVPNPGTLGADGLKAVTLNLGGGKLGGSSDAIHIIVKNGSKFTAPASGGLTRPAGDTGSYFMWLDSNGNSYAPGASVPADVTELTVQWTAPTYTVTLNAGDGTINSGNVTSYTYGVGATLPTDVTRTGYTFKGWYDNENLTSSPVTAISNTETGNKEYWAKWEINQYTITVKPENGKADITITQDYGTPITAPTLTREGYQFNGWDKTFPTTMPAENLTITAQWRYNGGGGSGYSYYTIKATAGAGGSISPSGNVSVREGRDQTFTITPDKGYAVANVKIDGKSIGAVKSYTFENVRRTHTIEVIFMKANGNPQTGVFVDVATGSYYEDAVDWAVENGITTGVSANRFDPNGVCTRAQAVTFLWRAAGSPKPKTNTMPFTDVNAGSYYYDAVLWAVENGITEGTSNTTFSPNATCTRAQIVAFLWRSEKSPAAGSRNPFADVKSTAYYADAVLWAVREDITKGTTNTTFSPDADCTRAQIVTFLWRCKK